jgi:hypothetical protein
MRILAIEKSHRLSTGQYREVAKFDAQITDDLRVFSIRLLESPTGRRIVQAPPMSGGRSATFGRPLAEALNAAASDALSKLEGDQAHANRTAA